MVHSNFEEARRYKQLTLDFMLEESSGSDREDKIIHRLPEVSIDIFGVINCTLYSIELIC